MQPLKFPLCLFKHAISMVKLMKQTTLPSLLDRRDHFPFCCQHLEVICYSAKTSSFRLKVTVDAITKIPSVPL